MVAHTEFEHSTQLLEQEEEVAPPPMYAVFLLNDDYTPMEFVVDVLQEIFSVTHDDAVKIMLTVHYQGKGLCGLYTRDIAEQKVAQVIAYARTNEHPLACGMEEQE